MLYESKAVPGAEPMLSAYQICTPVRVRIRWNNGVTDLVGLGLGCVVYVWEPDCVYPVGGRLLRTEIPIVGGTIIEFPTSLHAERISLGPSTPGQFFDVSHVYRPADRIAERIDYATQKETAPASQ